MARQLSWLSCLFLQFPVSSSSSSAPVQSIPPQPAQQPVARDLLEASAADQARHRRLLYSGIGLAMLGAIGFSGKAIIVKLAYRWQVDAITLLMYRMLLALPVFLLMAWWAGRRPGASPLTRRDWGGVLLLGFSGYYLASYLDFVGLQYISASLERLILYLNPTLVLLLGWLLTRKPVGKGQWAAMALSYAGVLLVFAHEVRWDGARTLLGAALVFASALIYAIYLVGSGRMVQRLGSLRLVGLASSVAAGFCLLQFLAMRPLSAALVPEPVLWLSLLNALACTVLPVWMVMRAVERIGSGLASQVGMVGPMATIAMGALLLDEPFTGWVLAGTVLVLAGVFAVTWLKR